MIRVRAARDDDDLDALNAGNRTWFNAITARSMFAAAPPTIPTGMWVAELDGVPVGYAHAVAAGILDGHRGMALVHVLPDHRRRGAGAALWHEVVALCDPDRVRGVLCSAADEDEASIAVALAHGFTTGGLHLESVLDLTRLGTRVEAAPLSAGVELRAMTDADGEVRWREVWELFNRLGAQAPDFADGSDDMPYAVFRALIAEPWQVLVAYDGQRLVGLTALAVRDARAGTLNTMLTAVDAAYRGRGLATALKRAQAHAVAAAGWRRITTQNMDGNAPILAANRRLGFTPGYGSRDLRYDHPSPSPAA